ncbi:MAG TPA: hypothetical protein VHR66_14170 [Gemmataceae bacterium]|jgi:hypothetical protein|nr:hypothetical protein [Gemmataceae bacterium]
MKAVWTERCGRIAVALLLGVAMVMFSLAPVAAQDPGPPNPPGDPGDPGAGYGLVCWPPKNPKVGDPCNQGLCSFLDDGCNDTVFISAGGKLICCD